MVRKDDFGFDDDFEDFDEFDELEKEDAKKKNLTLEEYEKQFIFEIEHGCPICRGTVKGNDHYKYFCKQCNILFDKKDLMQKGEIGDRHKYRVIPLDKEQKEEFRTKRKELSEKLKKAFPRPGEVKEKKKEFQPEPEVMSSEDAFEEPEVEMIPPYPEPEEDIEGPEEKKPEETEESGSETSEDSGKELPEKDKGSGETALLAALKGTYYTKHSKTEGLETEEDAEERNEKPGVSEPEFELEEEGKVIASKGSIKLHKGNCHFVRRIHPENRIYFASIEEGLKNNYELCVCLRRLVARKKAEMSEKA